MTQIQVSSVNELFGDYPQVEDDNLDEILDLLGKYNSNVDPNAFGVFVCSLLDQFCQDLDEESRQCQVLEADLDLDLALKDADLSLDEAIFDNIPEVEQPDVGKFERKESSVSLQHPAGVEEGLRLQFNLRPCSVILQRLDLPLTAQAETKNRLKRKRTEDVDWKPPVAVTRRRKSAVVVLRRSPRNISKTQF